MNIQNCIVGFFFLAASFFQNVFASSTTQTQDSLKQKAERIINDAIQTHGGELYNTANYCFVFRKNEYCFAHTPTGEYTYTVSSEDKSVRDELTNVGFRRWIDEKEEKLGPKAIDKYKNGLNSVVYFATLPHKLNDSAVRKTYVEETTINGQRYDVIQVTFEQEGGGKDHDDMFYYWVHQDAKTIDYLAYNYRVNGGGVRFRSAYNRRNIDGIIFQDYINWKAPVGTPLQVLPELFQNGKLKELSRILTENVRNNKEI